MLRGNDRTLWILIALLLSPPLVGDGRERDRRHIESVELTPPLVVNCGPSGEDGDGWLEEEEWRERARLEGGDARYLPDRRFDERRGYGHEGGEGVRPWYLPVAGTWGRRERHLFASARMAPESYRFRLPAGEFVLFLGFCELEEHLPERRVFDVVLQGRVGARGVDPFAIAGFGQSFRLGFPVTVRGGEALTIALERHRDSRRPPILSVIWIHPESAARRPPPEAPPRFRGFGSYGMNVLFWDHPADSTVGGYRVERRAPGESAFSPLTDTPVPVACWIDHDVVAGRQYEYRIQGVDVRGRRGRHGRNLSLAPLAPASSPLPVYSLELAPADLERVLSNVLEDVTVDGSLAVRGTSYPVEFRVRGASTRRARKLSYRIEFTGARPLSGRQVLFLKAEPSDYTLQQEKLTCDLFAALGLPVSQSRYVQLFINDRYQGVYLDIERIDHDFVRRIGFLYGTLMRSSSFQHLGREAGTKRGSHGRREDLSEFIRRLHRVDRGDLESFLEQTVDWPRVRDYLAASTICHRSEIEASDFFYYRPPRDGRWLLIPWDHNNGNFGVPGCGLEVAPPFMPLLGQTVQEIGYRVRHWYFLPSRIFNQETLRRDYLDRLEEMAREWLLSGRLDAFIDVNHEEIRDQVVVDPYRWPAGRDEPFLRSAADLRRFVRRHGGRLIDLIREERRRAPPPLVIGEFYLDADGGWVELWNRGPRRLSLEEHALTDIEVAESPRLRFPRGSGVDPGAREVFRLFCRHTGGDRGDARSPRAPRPSPCGVCPPGPLLESRPGGDAGVFSPRGGTLALVGPGAGASRQGSRFEEDDERRGERLLDWYVYGCQTAGFSYGRAGDRFGFLRPSPGRENGADALTAPPYVDRHRVTDPQRSPLGVTATLTELRPGTLGALVLYHDSGDGWKATPLPLEREDGERRHAVRATLPRASRGRYRLRYYFEARSPEGLVRYTPVGAPRQTFTKPVDTFEREDDD